MAVKEITLIGQFINLPYSLKEREKVPKGVRAIVINVYFGAFLDFDT